MATVRENTIELGVAAGTVIDASNSAAGGSSFTYFNGSPVTTATSMHGSSAADCSGNGVAAAFGWQSLSLTTFGYRYYVRRKSTPGATTQILTGRNSSNYIIGNNITTANKLTLNKWGGGVMYTSTTTLAQDTWYRVEGHGTIATATTGITQWKLFLGDSTTALEDSTSITNADFQTTPLTEWRLGKHSTGGLVEVILDDMILTDTATFPGPYVGALDLQPARSVVSNPGTFAVYGGAADVTVAVTDGSDTTGAISPGSPSGAAITYDFGALTANRQVKLNVRHDSPPDTGNISRQYALLQGSTVIATRTVNPLPSTVTAYTFTTTSGETAAITDWTNLRVRITDTLV